MKYRLIDIGIRPIGVEQAIHSAGFASLLDYWAAHPRLTEVEIARQLNLKCIPLLLTNQVFAEAARLGKHRWMIADYLVRALNESFPNGWDVVLHTTGPESDVQFLRASVYATWKTIVSNSYGDEVYPLLDKMWDFIVKEAPRGWKPKDANDPIIVKACALAWDDVEDVRSGNYGR